MVVPRSLLFGVVQSLPNALAAGTRSDALGNAAMNLLFFESVFVDILDIPILPEAGQFESL